MARNSLGKLFAVTSFGESHGAAVGVVIDGCPAGLEVDETAIALQLARRRPGQNAFTTSRKEADEFRIISGVFEGKTTGAPICIIIENQDQRPEDYEALKNVFRPGHADFTYQEKYGIRDHRGGGRSSARVTAGWVAAGALAEQILKQLTAISIVAYTESIHEIRALHIPEHPNRELVDASPVRCPDPETSEKMEAAIQQARESGDSLGGIITCMIGGCPPGLGEPVFGKLHAELGHAMLSINAVKGVEFGDGFAATRKKGSENNDALIYGEGRVHAMSNHAGGLLGGISNGEDILFRVAFKPTATIAQEQQTTDRNGQNQTVSAKGRHDPCVLPRAVPIVEAMAAIVMADLYLENRLSKI